MSASPFDDWRYRMSKLSMIESRWHVFAGDESREDWRRWRWFRPDDLVRYILHRSWSRRYW